MNFESWAVSIRKTGEHTKKDPFHCEKESFVNLYQSIIYSKGTNSTRRLVSRPAEVLLSAIGRSEP